MKLIETVQNCFYSTTLYVNCFVVYTYFTQSQIIKLK